MSFREHEVYPFYASLWSEAKPAIAHNEVTIDPHLSDRDRDRRRGLTVITRLSADVSQNIVGFMDTLRQLEPRQYYPQPDELHATILALFTATEAYQPYFDKMDAYRRVVREVLQSTSEFAITFSGVTASKGVVMVQGFPHDDALNTLREKLREAGLGESLDRLYRIRAAHVSVARFAEPLMAPQSTSELLQAHRETDFGTTSVQRLETVANDWYMSRDRVTLLDTHSLSREG